ncbi:nuclear GTPase SLIP-GC isoform X1 [Prionailurus viverrinus]|uniref:nuclear GTPase SLIP-GC isoform X1 n=1 Tax=Prionailurus viverrinus TaxID=61388 RepID=UPI001FF31D8E|nr:nuclear GTPase SLIP-GC isoform X1 [Prionailurus viverrinus]XP_047712885.1 nuclear GTPase SLIP-GC isoform X1 [Prionailurus viverrinus]XP_047712886.1 nuclear GTPase SLIP-GC isoform X1 [Prionailurus viverrinus]XP_047712887.1 nuclear GTPase SLIP-GC isoform X1 [Prionailurus viverrinus]XP_047712888.1 nuclear GTPase SLIP-GC isoform X1 [Prionailurus viverrinus]XP_047712889.1 nuclear GTPase SLIP-GC isoform X1 [Prionailurus viverrinus]
MEETEDFVGQGPHPVDDDLFKEPMKKRRRSDRDQRFRAFPSVEQSALKEYEKLESRTRRVLSNTYQKLIHSVFLDDSIPNGVKYLINRLLALIEKPSLDPIYIGLFGSTGAGKSSLINAIIQQAMFLPVSGESICTSCIVQVSSGCCEQYEAKIHLLSDQEWKEELKNLTKLLHRTEELDREEADAWDRDDAVEEAIWKLQMLYGNGAERKNYEELLRAKPKGKIPTSRIITLKAEEAEELSVKLDPYIRTHRRDLDGESAETQIWPLIKHVEVTLPKSEMIPEGVVLVDIPGTGDFNSKRDEMWKKTIDKCSVIWLISDIERVSGGRAHEDLLNESIKACQRGFCRDVALVVTKTDKLHLLEYLRERKVGNQAIQSQREAVLERNEVIKLQRNRILKEKLKRKLPADSKVLEASDLVYTVSAQEYWQQALLTEEETEIPKLRGYIRKRLLDKKRRMVTKYVTEAFGLLLLTDSFNCMENLPNEFLHMSGLRRFVEEKIQLLEKVIDQCFAHIKQPLQEGVRNAKASYRRILGTCLVRSRGNQGFHQTLKAVCLKNGIYASRTLARIDLNEAITQPIYDQIDPVFGGIFRAGKPTGSALLPHVEAFKHSLQEKMMEIGIRSGWKYDSDKKSFLIQEISAILGGLEDYILRKKRRIYESLTTSVQSDLKACYEEAAQIAGKKACERMKDVIRRGVDRQVAEGMFERAQERMQHQFQQLKNGITEKVKGSIATMLTLASSQGDGLYKELADVKSEYKEMEKLHRGLREVAENAVLRRGMQDFLLKMSPSKVVPPKL